MTHRIEFRVLGAVEVLADGEPLDLNGRKSRELLAFLLLHANEAVTPPRIVDALWGDDAPLTVDASLRVAVSKLRKALEPAGARGLVETRHAGYAVRVEPEQLDASRFESLVARGRAAHAQGQVAEAEKALEDAFALWRGEPYAEISSEPGAEAESRRLQELRLDAREDLFDARLALGRHTEVVPELERLVEQHPSRERLAAQLMVALYRSGRQADALDVYRRTRTRLRDDLGLEPGPELRELEQAILRHDPALDLMARAAGPAPSVAAAPRRGRQALFVVGGAVLAITGAALVLVTTTGGAPSGLEPHQVGALENGDLEKAVDVGARPIALTEDGGQLWVANAGDGTLTRIDLSDREARDTIPVGGQPSSIAAADGSVWVAESGRGWLLRVNASTGGVVQRIPVGVRPSGVTVGFGSVWVANSGDATISRVDAASGRELGETSVAAEPTAVAAGEGAVWVAHDASGVVTRLDARSGEPVAAISVGGGARAVTVAMGAVWVANAADGTMSRIDPRRNAVTATIDVGGEPSAIAAHDGAIWVSDSRGGIAEIDPTSAEVSRRANVGQNPSALASAGDALWVATLPSAAGKGGVLRVEAYGIPSIDPADGHLVDGDVLRLVYDGLLAYRPAEGTAGNALVPSLAESLPLVTADGRAYTFRLREGIVFSDGTSVRPRDVERSIERAKTVEWGEIMLGGIEDVTANDDSRTVVLRLREPDPDFLYKLALPVGAVLPSSAPARITSPVPGTGPYRIEAYDRERRIVLVRNERFRSWSETTRPGGLADRIVVRFIQDPDKRRDDVLAGRADVAPYGLAPEPGVLATPYASQFHRWALPQTHFLFLNTRERPFDDMPARRAVALAVNRSRVAAIFGGPDAVTPTCQHLPPTIPGYSPYCPFTAQAGGVSPKPDLARARTLVAASGTRGTAVTVWAPTDPAERAELGRYTVRVLRSLGYDARLELRPDLGSYLEAALDPDNNVQIGLYSWGNDFPTAGNTFFPMYACARGIPHEFNPSRFCDAALSRRLNAALTGTAREPTPAKTWEALDHSFLDTGAMIPLVNTTSTVVVSERLENLVLNPQFGPLLELASVR